MKVENVQFHNVAQGSTEWHALRAGRCTASMAAAALGRHKYTSRSQLLAKLNGAEDEEPGATQRKVYQRGHDAEAAARPLTEQRIGEELYPATVTADVDGIPMLVSVDGLTMAGDILWEHKLLNQSLQAQIDQGQLEDHYLDQIQQGLLLTGAEECLFEASDGTEEGKRTLPIKPDPERQAQIVAGWKQALEDAKEYTVTTSKPQPVGNTPESLPALKLQAEGRIVASNLPEFRETALAVIGAINTDLATDADFATAESTVKWAKDVEAKLKAKKQEVLEQTADISEVFDTIDDVAERMRQTRLQLEKLVKERKEELRTAEIARGQQALAKHVGELEAALEHEAGVQRLHLSEGTAHFQAAAKGKRNLDSIREAIDTTLANAKIAVNAEAERVRASIAVLHVIPDERAHLFPDRAELLTKAPGDLHDTIKARIAEEDQRIAEKAKAEQERLEREKLERDAREKAAEADRETAQPEPAASPQTADQVVDDLNAQAPREPVDESTASRFMAQPQQVRVVTATFEVPDEGAVASMTDADLAATLTEKLRSAGFQSITHVAVRRQEDAA